jgi:Mg-chelatase subunit ChlD
MTRPDLTDITFVLDRSGSMGSIKGATIESFNGFVHSQRTGAGTAQLTLIQFDDQYEQVYSATSLHQVPDLNEQTFVPRGATALLDAMGRAIAATGERLRQLPEHERPGNVVFVTLTDGYENASRDYSLLRLNEMIREQREKYSWQFVFLGANQDAIATAAKMDIGADHAMTFAATFGGTGAAFGAVDRKMHKMRHARFSGDASGSMKFDDEDREAAKGSDH